MAIQTINIGNIVNDGLGDDLRTAFQKVNSNFSELSSSLTVTASNAGSNGVGIFKEKLGNDLVFKRLVPEGNKISLIEYTDSIVIRNNAPDSFTSIITNSNSVSAAVYPAVTLQGSKNLDIVAFGGSITIDTILPVTDILSYYDFGPITGEFTNSVQLVCAASNIDFGTVEYPSRFSLDCGTLSA